MKKLKKVALAVSSFALALSPVFSGGAWALTRADVEEDIAENDEIVELNIDLVNGKSYTFDGLSAECLKAAFENGGFSSAAVAFDEEENDFVLVEGTDAEGALFEFAVDGDNVSVKSTVAAGVDYPVQSFVDTLLFGCPVAVDEAGEKRIATEFLELEGESEGEIDDQILVGDPDDLLPRYEYHQLWVFATIKYGNENNPDTFDATKYFLIMLGASTVPVGLMCVFQKRRHGKRR